ncbi:MAG TPA: mechanosensitive ion channel domain-containing protein [Verrucomicrobiae bacterium]|nr:mechanosensitive ion channel domain-containing protein [Verrucomicrobiae bacterium]
MNQANAFFSNVMEGMFGPGVQEPVLGRVTWVDVGMIVCLLIIFILIHACTAGLLRWKTRQLRSDAEPATWRVQLFVLLRKPLFFAIWLYGLYFALTLLRVRLAPEANAVQLALDRLLDVGVFCLLCWLFVRFTRVLETRLGEWAAKSESKLDDALVPLLAKVARVAVPVIAVILALPVLGLPAAYSGLISKASSLLIIGCIAWALVQAAKSLEEFILGKYDLNVADNLQARKVYTQVKVISKTVYFIIGVFTVASALMMFEEVRRVGTSILASAGVLGVIIGFAAQKTIANLFAGFQLAMTQPIRLDDVVIVESEWGRIEEITLTYVVVHIWDERRLVVPLSYFIEKPFQNWTRVSANLLGSVFFWTDYTLPVGELRRAVKQVVESCEDWDKRYWNLQVTDTSERTMQVRVLATAADSGKAWNLRCEIREKVIEMIQSKYPQSLPKIRGDLGGAGGQGNARPHLESRAE